MIQSLEPAIQSRQRPLRMFVMRLNSSRQLEPYLSPQISLDPNERSLAVF